MNCTAAHFGICLFRYLTPFQNQDNETPLHVASMRGDQAIVEILLGSGADVNLKTKFVSDFIYQTNPKIHLKLVCIGFIYSIDILHTCICYAQCMDLHKS